MIWNSVGIMSTIDILIVGVVFATLYIFLKQQKPLTDFRAAGGPLAVAFGLGVTGVFYSADLFTMLILPRFIPRADAMSFMAELHLNFRWILTVVATVTMSLGFLNVVRKMRGDAHKFEQSLVALRESEERSRLFMDSATEHFTLYDGDLNLIDANAHTLEMLAWNKEDVFGRNLAELFPGAASSGRLQKYRNVLETGESLDMEIRTYAPEVGQIELFVRVFKAGDGIGVCSGDITERRKVEAALRESEERRRLFMDSATEHFTLYDADLNLIDANTRTLETLAWNKEDVIGRNVVDLFPDCVVSGRLQRYRKVIETGEPFDEEVGTYSGEDGLGKAVLRVFTAGGGIGITSADITEQTKAEAALRESQARLNAFFAEAPAGLVILDHDLRYIKINETLARYHGLTAEDHVGRPLHDVSPLVAESLSHIFRQVLKTGEPVLNLEYEGEMPGSPPIKTVNITSIFPVLGADGTPQAVGAISSDISDKKRAEAALHESEELRRLFMDLASDNFALFDSDLNLLSANAAALVYLGGSLEDAVGKQLLELLPDFAGSERYQRYLEVARTGRRYDSEVTIRRKDGETVHCAISAFRAGEGIGVISRDITARKQAEAALRESEELRKRFMDSAGATFALFDAELNFLDINAASPRHPETRPAQPVWVKKGRRYRQELG